MKNVIRKNWRDAATLIVLSKRAGSASSSGGSCNYDVLLQTRTQRASFKKGVVFPGGVYESADASPEWLQLLGSYGYSQSDFEALHRTGAPVTPLFQDNPVQRQIHLRITAIRETFEELGLLICSCTPKKDKEGIYSDTVSDIDVGYWQDQVSKDPSKLLTLCKEVQCYPDIWSLHYWSNWLTPAHMKKRFDTAFYITTLDTRPAIRENSEVAKVEWLSPTEILQLSCQPDIVLYPPQSYELNRLANWSDLKEIAAFANQRSSLGGHLFYHSSVQATDGLLYVFPGDDLFPKSVDYNTHTVVKSKKTVYELRESTKSAHRFEFHHNSEIFLVFKNFKPDNVDMGDKVIKVHVTLST